MVSRRAGRPKSQRSRAVNPGGDPGYWRRAALAIFRNAVQAGRNIRRRACEVAATPDVTAAPSQTAVAIPAKSVAVLPFENLSAEKDNAYFADGIQDEILTGLAKIGDLKVISRTSTQGYGSRPQNLAEIGRQLGVAHVLEGSVQKAGNRVRVNVQLIDAASDDHLWAETYDRTLEDVFAVETEVAQKIASSLQAQLTRDERAALTKKPTDNPAAYDAYLKARSLLLGSSYDRVNTERILDSLESAVKLDPGFAEAWAQLSITNSWIYWSGFDPTPARLAAAKSALDRAAALEPGLPRVQKAHALYVYFGERDFAAALNIWRSLQQSLPNDDEVWYFTALLERRLGLFDAAVADFERARILNPNGVVLCDGTWPDLVPLAPLPGSGARARRGPGLATRRSELAYAQALLRVEPGRDRRRRKDAGGDQVRWPSRHRTARSPGVIRARLQNRLDLVPSRDREQR